MALPDDALKSSQGALFVQVNGPNTKPVYAGCVTLDDVTAPDGDVELIRCFDPSGRGWKTVGQTKAPPRPGNDHHYRVAVQDRFGHPAA